MDLVLLVVVAGIGLMLAGVILIFVTSPAGIAVVALGSGTSVSALALQGPVAEARLFRFIHVSKGQPLTIRQRRPRDSGQANERSDAPRAA